MKEGYLSPKTDKFSQFNFSLPDFHKVKVARRRGPLQLKVGEVQHYMRVDLHNDLEDAISVGWVVVRVIG